jgi:hypothetical protein
MVITQVGKERKMESFAQANGSSVAVVSCFGARLESQAQAEWLGLAI